MAKKNQSSRLTIQQENISGATGIFGKEAIEHDAKVGEIAYEVLEYLQKEYPTLEFRHRKTIAKIEINQKLQQIDSDLGKTLFLKKATIKPDGGILEVKDDCGNWRVILVSEAKYQGKDNENIKKGKLLGKKKSDDLMDAGNAIERSHKNIAEIANFMLLELHFPYVLFLQGTNFLTETIKVERPDGRVVTLSYDSGKLNRLDRLTASNYGMPINTNLCVNKFIHNKDKNVMLQAASIYTQGNGDKWKRNDMLSIMLEIAHTSLKVLGSDLFDHLTAKK